MNKKNEENLMKIKGLIVAILMALAGCSASIHADDARIKNPDQAKSGYQVSQTGTSQPGDSAVK